MRKRRLLLGDSISKWNLNLKVVKAEFSDEKEKFSSCKLTLIRKAVKAEF